MRYIATKVGFWRSFLFRMVGLHSASVCIIFLPHISTIVAHSVIRSFKFEITYSSATDTLIHAYI
jgi:hypothetical protein